MNIELLNEIKQSLQDGKNLSDIASELAMQKNFSTKNFKTIR